MIQRTYRNLLLRLHYRFSQDDGNAGKEKVKQQVPKKTKNEQKTDKQQTPNAKLDKQPKFKNLSGLNKQSREHQKTNLNKEKTDEKGSQIIKQLTPSFEKFQWQKKQPIQANVQSQKQIDKIRKSFILVQERKLFEKEVLKQIKNANFKDHQSLTNKFLVYLEKDLVKGKQFILQNILSFKSTTEGKQFISTIVDKTLNRYIEEEDLRGLINFSEKIGDLIEQRKMEAIFKESKVTSLIESVGELAQTPEKYEAIQSLLRLGHFDVVRRQRTNFMVKSLIQKFLIEREKSTAPVSIEVLKSFEEMFQIILKNRLVPEKYNKSDSFFQLMEKLYFNRENSQQVYEKLFNLISSTKSTTDISEGQLEEFYYKFLTAIENGQLQSTDCEHVPLQVNEFILKKYHQFIANPKKEREAILAILAISTANKYLSIPEHFLKEVSKQNRTWISQSLLDSLNQNHKLATLLQLVKSGENNEGKIALITQLSEKRRPLTNLKTAIISKDYQLALSIYQQEFFKKICLQKQHQIIKNVLKKFYSEQNIHPRNQKELSQKIQNFVGSLSSEYLWQSWKKREDLGYLLEDYYIKEGDEPELKAEKRFSFWQTYFERKRAREINKMQKLNELKSVKEPTLEPLLDSEFNLNKYLEGQSFTRYRTVADYNDKKEQELDHYIKKVELILMKLEKSREEVDKSKVLADQAQLCQQNLQILEYFGIKDYDLQAYEANELANRLDSYKKLRGVPRLNSIYNREFKDQSQAEKFYKQKLKPFKYKKIVKSNPDKTKQSVAENEKVEPQANANDAGEVASVDAKESNGQKHNAQEVEIKAETSNQLSAQEEVEPQQPEQGVSQQTQEPLVPEPEIKHISSITPSQIQLGKQVGNNEPTMELVDILRVKRPQLFNEFSANIRLKPTSMVEKLIRWGVLNREPMGIYMGEKLAMMTGQTIPHRLAVRVSDLFAYHREIDQQLFKECKVCLTYIGRIEREVIYDSNYHYHHIHHRPRLAHSIVNFNEHLKNRLEDLVMENPNTLSGNMEPRQAYRKLAKGTLL